MLLARRRVRVEACAVEGEHGDRLSASMGATTNRVEGQGNRDHVKNLPWRLLRKWWRQARAAPVPITAAAYGWLCSRARAVSTVPWSLWPSAITSTFSHSGRASAGLPALSRAAASW